jgi:magnesium transporter
MPNHQKGNGKSTKDYLVNSVPRAHPAEKVGEVEALVLKNAGSFSAIDYVYITDRDGVLCGVVSLKRLLSAQKKSAKVEEVMEKNPVVAHPATAKERLVYLALSHRIKAIPIVEKGGRLLGVVPYDALLQIFNEEVREDALKFGGVFHRVGKEMTMATSPVSVMIWARLPWLILGVIGGSLAATIISGFEAVLATYLMLAAFIPVLVYLSDAAGTQSEALIIRGLALDPKLPLRKYILREIKIAVVLGLVCGGLLGIISALGWGFPFLGIIVGASVAFSVVCAVLISTLLPLLFLKFNADPAVATGPFATLVSDLATILIYFTVATWLLQEFGFL